MNPFLDPAPAARAGERHGQLASALSDGGLAVSGHKVVEEGARAQLLIVPGLIRIDVSPLEDGIQVIPRPLVEAELGWAIDETVVAEYGQKSTEAEHPATARFTFALWLEPRPIGGRLLISHSRGEEHETSHFVGHAIFVEVGADG